MLTYTDSNCNIQLNISQKAIPSSWPSPLVCASKIAISVCSVILHCQKYHFLGRWHCACCPRLRQLQTTYSVQLTALCSTDDDNYDYQFLPAELRNRCSFGNSCWHRPGRHWMCGTAGLGFPPRSKCGCSGRFVTQLLFHNASSGKIFWC